MANRQVNTSLKSQPGDETISTDVDTGRKASSGTSGTVFVSGTAVALNALANGGQFSISYDITIP